jgi:RND family efflux transporter MFP subunit
MIEIRNISRVLPYLTLLTLFTACNLNTSSTTQTEPTEEIINEPLPIGYTIINPVSFHEEIISNGKIHAWRKAELHFKTQGNLVKINFRNGEWAEAGAIIASLDNRAEEIGISNAKDQINKAILELNSLMLGYGGISGDSNSVPAHIYESLKVQCGYIQASNNLQTARLQYNNTIIKAPFNGIVTDIETQTHNMISAGEVFCHLLDNSKYIVEFPVIENELSLIKTGQMVRVIPFAIENIVLDGSISEINPSVDEHGLVRVKALLPGNNNQIFDGMNVKIFIEKEIKNQLVIPREALVLRSNKEVVFTFKNGFAKWNYVTVANENSTSYMISNGLNAGDTVIVSGNLNLAHDARVRIAQQ